MKNVDDIYPLSPLQSGLLFHTVADEQAGMYVEQLSFRVEGPFEPAAFIDAWEVMLRRHPVLRTCFLWAGLDAPVQVVRRDVRLPVVEEDWRGLDRAEQERRVDAFLHDDQARGFELTRAPLLRIALLRLADHTYQVVCTNHHLIFDGWSRGVLFGEVMTAYHAPGQAPALPPARAFGDYIAWLQHQDLGAAEHIWRSALKGFSAPTPLPAGVPGGTAGRVVAELSPEVSARVSAVGRRLGVTVGTVVQFAWAVLLGRCAGVSDVVFGVTVAGRPVELAGVDRMVGLFINTLPARVVVDADVSVAEGLRRAQEWFVGVREFEYAPLVQVQGWSEVPRGVPLFDTLVVVENYPVEDGAGGGDAAVRVEEVRVAERTDTALTLVVAVEERLRLRLLFRGDRFDEASASGLLGQVSVLLEQMSTDAEVTVGRLSLLSPTQEHALIQAWNPTPTPTTGEQVGARPLIDRFLTTARTHPDRIALIDGDRQTTYGHLHTHATHLATTLTRHCHVQPDDLVALLLPRHTIHITAILATHLAGAAYLPMDPDYPPTRLHHLLTDSHATVLLTTTDILTQHPDLPTPTHTHTLDTLDTPHPHHTPNTDTDTGAAPNLDPDTLAYVIYTSGSTGTPKGVTITHRQAARLFDTTHHLYQPGPHDTWTLFHSLAFDFSVWELWGALTHGARLVLVDHDTRHNPTNLAHLIDQHTITILNQTPSAFLPLTHTLTHTHHLRHIIFGGENLPTHHLTTWHHHHGLTHPTLTNMYGITETTIHATHHTLTPTDLTTTTSNIGHPLNDLRIHLLDPHLHPTPTGQPGEIHLAGAGLARGYLHQPTLTATRFIPNPYGPPGDRLYRTGDRARTNPDGTLTYLGRTDHQIQLRGHRIEPAEIQHILHQHPHIHHTIITTREDHPNDHRLTAYYTTHQPHPDHTTLTHQLRTLCHTHLPPHMHPAHYIHLTHLPLTPHGKIDTHQLPPPTTTHTTPTTHTGTHTPTTTILTTIWHQLLHTPTPPHPHDNFFHLGGDSILGMQIAARANQAGIPLRPRDLFRHPTIAELAELFDAAPLRHDTDAVTADERPGPVPLTPIQHWYFAQERLSAAFYNQALTIGVEEPVDEAALRSALLWLLARHDALRLRFAHEGPDWRATVTDVPEATGLVTVLDLRKLPQETARAAMLRAATAAHASFDLATGPLIHAVLGRHGETGNRLLLVAHHLVVDAVSWRLLIEDLRAAYDGYRVGTPPARARTSASYAQWARRLSEHARSAEMGAQLPYWLAAADGAPGTLPADDPGAGAGEVGTTRTVERVLGPAPTRRLLRTGATPARTQSVEVLLGALALVLDEWTGRDSTLIHLEGHGRESAWPELDVSATVGWFTSIYPLRLDGGPPRAALLAAKQRLRAVPDGGIGYHLLRYQRAGDEAAARLASLPEPELLFNYLGQFSSSSSEEDRWRLVSEPTGEPQDGREQRRYALEVSVAATDEGLHVRWTFNPRRHRPETIDGLADRFLRAVEELVEVVADPHAVLLVPDDFPLAAIDQPALDRLAGLPGGVADVYPLSPLQQGMLFHLLSADTGGVNVEQVTCRLAGPVDLPALRRAWAAAARRHAVLRTSFHWREHDEPIQVVHHDVDIPWAELDWRHVPADRRDDELEGFLRADRRERFVPERAPLMRLTVIRLDVDLLELVWTHHHLLLDGWSLARVVQEVFTVYRAARHGGSAELPEPRPYRDYIAWLHRQDPTEARAFWHARFAGFTAPTPLPVEPGPKPDGESGSVVRILPDEPTRSLVDFARREGLTVGTLVQAAWALLLHRHSREDTVVFGTVVAGRPAELPSVETMVGQFINSQPILVDVRREQRLGEWLHEVQGRLADARQFEHTALTEIQGVSGVPRDQPLFHSVVVFENYFVERTHTFDADAAADGFSVEHLDGREQTNYPLTLVAAPGREIRLELLYDGGEYTPDTARRYLDQLTELLTGMVAAVDGRVADLSASDGAERAQLVQAGTGSRAAVPYDTSLTDLIDAQVGRTPDQVAVVDERAALTYAQLQLRVRRLAGHLRAAGVRPEDRVALCLDRSVDFVVAVLAVFQAGAAYLPVDPALSARRIGFMLADADVRAVVTTRAGAPAARPAGVAFVLLDDDRDRIAAMPAECPPPAGTPQSLAYLIYTSGSTGVPKGAMVERRGMVNHLFAKVHDLRLTAADVVAATAPTSFDISVWQCLAALLVGATTRVLPDSVTQHPARLLAETQRHGVTVLEVVPAMLRAVLDVAGPVPDRLRWLLLTGEALPADLCREWLDRCPTVPVVNAYGPTECSDDVTHHVITEPPRGDRGSVPIGRPILHTRLYVLDRDLRPVPSGAAGELYVGGAGVGRGYLGRPGRTATAFVPDPFTSDAGGRLYRTGDLARWQPDGTLQFLGRIDHQVKLRGFRIEPGEIEAVLTAHPSVRAAVVTVVGDPPGNQRLAAYVVADDRSVEPDVLSAHCAAQLPPYMVPDVIVPLDAFPLTPNGKLDRKALPAVVTASADGADEAPASATEREIAAIWADLLGLDRVGRHTGFFAAGGHSLLAMRVMGRLAARGVDLPMRALFEAPTLAAFAARVAGSAPAGPADAELRPRPADRADPALLRPAAAVVPGPLGAGRPELQPSAGRTDRGAAPAAGPGGGPAWTAAPARGAPYPVRRRRRRAASGRRARARARPARHRPARGRARPASVVGPSTGPPGGPAALRPPARSAAADPAAPPGAGRPRAVARPAPHRQRRLVPGCAAGGRQRAVRGGGRRPPGGPARAGGAVSGLRDLAAGTAVRRPDGRRTGLLAGAVGGRADPAAAPDRPAAAGGPHVAGSASHVHPEPRGRGRRPAAGGPRERHAVHGAVRRLRGAAGPAQRPGAGAGGQPDGQPATARA